ncbi:IS66 family insertion sequence element accessory protein TnpA [Solidesulfovibrio alcoholivorans]|uniref:IS66 family insertion sequence element accessory protein TnpA n=1 Tax=Solidesulfovibrio alcoholivorans TaxID=81406 RepID=UPI0009FF5862
MTVSATEPLTKNTAYWAGISRFATQGACCRQHALSQRSRNYWRTRLTKASGKDAAQSVTIVPVALPAPPQGVIATPKPILVHGGDNFRIEIRGNFSVAVFEKLIRTLARL